MGVRLLLARFLRRLRICFGGSTLSAQSSHGPDVDTATHETTAAQSTASPSEPEPINDVERLSRFITDHSNYSVVNNTVNFRAFVPRRHDNELSIMRTDELGEPQVWALGDVVAAPSGRTVYARGDFTAPDVRESAVGPWRLTVRADNDPPRHAVIEGWPPPTHSDATEARKNLAQLLRARAVLRVRPTSTPA